MNKLIVIIAILTILGCTTAFGQSNQLIDQTKKIDRVQMAFAKRDIVSLIASATDQLKKLQNVDPATRKKIFEQLSKGDTSLLEERLGKDGLSFFEITRVIEGYLDGYPSVKQLNKLYEHWESSRNLWDFYSNWNRPVITGFGMMYLEDLEKIQDGRRYLGFRLYNSGRFDWPKSLQIEPFMANPDKGVDIKTLPRAIEVLNPDGSAVRPGAVIDVYFDVTEVKAEKGTNIYLVSTYEEEKGLRRYVIPLLDELVQKYLGKRLYMSF